MELSYLDIKPGQIYFLSINTINKPFFGITSAFFEQELAAMFTSLNRTPVLVFQTRLSNSIFPCVCRATIVLYTL